MGSGTKPGERLTPGRPQWASFLSVPSLGTLTTGPLKTRPRPHSLDLMSLRFAILEKEMPTPCYFTGLL